MLTSLQHLIADERQNLGLSLREAAARSGGKVTSSTIHAIERGARTTVTDTVAEGLAVAFSLPLDLVLESAGMPSSDLDKPFVLPKRASRLTRKERDHVLELVDLLLARRAK